MASEIRKSGASAKLQQSQFSLKKLLLFCYGASIAIGGLCLLYPHLVGSESSALNMLMILLLVSIPTMVIGYIGICFSLMACFAILLTPTERPLAKQENLTRISRMLCYSMLLALGPTVILFLAFISMSALRGV